MTPVELELGDGYLARVDWFPDSKHLAVQRQTRDQKRLDLLKVDVASGSSQRAADGDEPELDRAAQRPALPRDAGRRSCGARGARATSISICTISTASCCGRSPPASGWSSATASRTDWSASTRSAATCTSWRTQPRRSNASCTSTSLDTRTPEAPRRISREAGWHDAKLLPGARGYLDLYSSPDQPPTASLHKLDGSLQHWLVRNALDATHPYHEFLADHVKEEFGSIAAEDGQQLNYRLLKPAGLQAGKRYPVIVDVYGGPHNQYVKQGLDGRRARAARLLPPDSRAARLRRVHARQSRLGFPRQRVRNRARAAPRQSRDHGSAARRGVPEDAAVRRSATHRHHGLELRRLHDADGAHDDRRVQSRRGRRAGHRLAALRHALHRALSRLAERQRERLRGERSAAARRRAARQAAAGARHGGRQRAVHAQHDADAGAAIASRSRST